MLLKKKVCRFISDSYPFDKELPVVFFFFLLLKGFGPILPMAARPMWISRLVKPTARSSLITLLSGNAFIRGVFAVNRQKGGLVGPAR